MNNVTLTGRLTKDIEIRKTNSNKSVASFTIAVRKDKETSDFINCVAWEHTADFLSRYAWKGARVGIQGSISTRSYDDRDGNKRYVTEVLAKTVEILDKKPEAQESYQPVNESFRDLSRQAELDAPEITIEMDELPFY